MGPLAAAGGVYVPSDVVSDLEREIDALCAEFGFPPGERFKWSPARNMWMYNNLIGQDRENFFTNVLDQVRESNGKAIVVIEDTSCNSATPNALNGDEDVTRLLIERVHWLFDKKETDGLIIIDRPGGGRDDEERFLRSCFETLQSGTDYVKPDKIALNVLSSPSKFIRLLQVADVIVSCTVARIAGENCYSPPIFDKIKPLLHKDRDRIGGVGLKIHPDYKYVNLYHWLGGDVFFLKASNYHWLPLKKRLYNTNPDSP